MTSRYEALLDAVVVLALFIPVVLALAESVSIQSVTLTLQSLRGPRRSLIPEARPLWKEFATAILLGDRLRQPRRPRRRRLAGQRCILGLTILTAITLSMVTACVLGVVLPAILYAVRRDPSIAAGPIVLAIADLCTLVFYFNLAGWVL